MYRAIENVRTWRSLALHLAVVALALAACGPAATTEPDANAGADVPLLTWQREGGLAGFCDELSVMADGRVVASTCRGGDDVVLGEATLTPEQQAQLEEWVSRLEAFDIEQTDPATADAMTVRLALAGQGSEKVTDQDLQAISDFVGGLFLAAGGLPEGPTPTPEVFNPLPEEERAFAAARAALAAELGIDELSITRLEIEAVEWTDSCLGLGGPAESCLQAITPGYRLMLQAGGETYEVRTNQDASAVRIAEGEQLTAEESAFAAARAALAAELGIDEQGIALDEIERQDWTDSCLGLGGPAESCLQAITPGYRLTLEVGGETYEVRTSLDLTAVRIAGIEQP